VADRAIDGAGFRVHAIAALLLLGLALRGAIPAGWMPSFEGSAVALVPCSGWTAGESRSPTVHSGGHQADSDHHGAHDSPNRTGHEGSIALCSFAAVAADLPNPGGDIVLRPAMETEQRFMMSASVSVGRGLAAPPPPSTGPPQLT
jgi:hypothetical protein